MSNNIEVEKAPDNIHAALLRSGDLLAGQIKINVRDKGLPDDISKSTEVEPPERMENIQFIDVVVHTGENEAPMAGAFEWGSGLHSTKGEPAKYPIDPIKGEYLAFEWENEPKIIQERAPHLPDGRVLLKHVDHPGVRPEPYMAPAIQEKNDEIARTIGDAFLEILGPFIEVNE